MTDPLSGSYKLLHEPPLMHNPTWIGTSSSVEVKRMIACTTYLHIEYSEVFDALFFELPSSQAVVHLA